jgi:2-polyprenyl-3-methyl-5-hydroxy-6-metoxy-1,4-benzoquinol methylase
VSFTSRLAFRLFPAFSTWNRARKARFVAEFGRVHGVRSVLLVGVGEGWEPRWFLVESAAASLAATVIACDLHPRTNTPWTYVRADALALPFRDGAFDLVVSNAVIEHVGQEREQTRFVAEHARVGRHWLVTTPNRWFPVESHTGQPLRHWSARWRASREEYFSRLLSRRELRPLLPEGSSIHGRWYSPTFIAASDQTT